VGLHGTEYLEGLQQTDDGGHETKTAFTSQALEEALAKTSCSPTSAGSRDIGLAAADDPTTTQSQFSCIDGVVRDRRANPAS
jgi:hypothetical protein